MAKSEPCQYNKKIISLRFISGSTIKQEVHDKTTVDDLCHYLSFYVTLIKDGITLTGLEEDPPFKNASNDEVFDIIVSTLPLHVYIGQHVSVQIYHQERGYHRITVCRGEPLLVCQKEILSFSHVSPYYWVAHLSDDNFYYDEMYSQPFKDCYPDQILVVSLHAIEDPRNFIS